MSLSQSQRPDCGDNVNGHDDDGESHIINFEDNSAHANFDARTTGAGLSSR